MCIVLLAIVCLTHAGMQKIYTYRFNRFCKWNYAKRF